MKKYLIIYIFTSIKFIKKRFLNELIIPLINYKKYNSFYKLYFTLIA